MKYAFLGRDFFEGKMSEKSHFWLKYFYPCQTKQKKENRNKKTSWQFLKKAQFLVKI